MHVDKATFICADWNICQRDERTHPIFMFLQDNGFLPVFDNPKPTHKEGRCIDSIWTKNVVREKVDLKIDFAYFSDHGILTLKYFI